MQRLAAAKEALQKHQKDVTRSKLVEAVQNFHVRQWPLFSLNLPCVSLDLPSRIFLSLCVLFASIFRVCPSSKAITLVLSLEKQRKG